MEKRITKLIRSVPKRSRHLKVFHELEPDYYSATSATFIGQIYRIFGFRNVADAADTAHTGYPKLSAEYVIAANPDLIVLMDTRCCGQSPATVAARPGWGGLAAVKRHAIVRLDDSIASRWGPRVVSFVKAVASALRTTAR